MAATATESSSSCTWGSVCKGIATIGLVVVVGYGIGLGAWYAAGAMGATTTQQTIAQFGSSLVAGFTGVTNAIVSPVANFVGLGGDVIAGVPAAAAVDMSSLDAADKALTEAADKAAKASSALVESEVKLFREAGYSQNPFAEQVDAKKDLTALANIERNVATSADTLQGRTQLVKDNIPHLSELKDSAKTYDARIAFAESMKQDHPSLVQQIDEYITKVKAAKDSVIPVIHGHNGLASAVGTAGTAPTSTTALATAAGAGAAATAGVAYLASGRGEPVGKHTQMLRDRDALRQAAYDEAMGQGVPVRG